MFFQNIVNVEFIYLFIPLIYIDFISKVADGRDGLDTAEVNKIGQGRVWTGKEAVNIKLVDEIGGIDKAIDYAANKANISKHNIQVEFFPEEKPNKILEILEMIDNEEYKSKSSINPLFNTFLHYLNTYKDLESLDKYQARLPYEIIIK